MQSSLAGSARPASRRRLRVPAPFKAAALFGAGLVVAGCTSGLAGTSPAVPATRSSHRPAAASPATTSFASTAADVAGTPVGLGEAKVAGGAPSSQADPVVGIVAAPGTAGYWIVAASGAVFSFGGARFHGSMGATKLVKPIVGMAAAPDGKGYWLVASDGGIFSFGDAKFHGSTGAIQLRKPIVGMAATPDGLGYWLVASDGGIFSFGDAKFHGSAATDDPQGGIVAMAAAPGGQGYWLVSSQGGIYTFGHATFHGALAGTSLHNPIVGIAATPDGSGYWLLPSTPQPPPPPPVPPLPPGFVRGHVTSIGDSVMVDAEPDLQADIPGIDVEAQVSRFWDAGVALAQQLRAEDDLGAIVVVDLGTNGPVSTAQFQNMMSVLAGATRVVFVTVHLPPSYSWSQSVNATLEQGVKLYPNTRLADFNALADQNPQWFGGDGVHMPIGGTGAQAMASLIAATIRGA